MAPMPASPERRAAAMAMAVEVRERRAAVQARLSSGETTLEAVLDEAAVDDIVATIKVLKVVEALPGAGKVASRRSLAVLGIDESARLGRLDAGDREALIREFAVP